MEDTLKDLYESCEYLADKLKEFNEKVRRSGGTISNEDMHLYNELTHAIKSVKTTIAMEEAGEEKRGYSSYGGSYGEGSSYARGRRNAPRDSMGRYSGADVYGHDMSRADGNSYRGSYADGMSRDYMDGGLSEIINIARGKMVGLPPDEKRRRVQMLTEELSK